MSLKTDYKDDILAVGNLRKYQMIQNNDGTVSFQDVTQYEQTGDVFGAGDINRTNQAVNEKFDSGDVVDPMLTTEPGFAADAYQTKLQFDAQNKNFANGFKWNLIGTGIGEYEFTKYNEILIVLQDTANLLNYSIPVPIATLIDTDKIFRHGHYFASSHYAQAFITISKTRLTAATINFKGSTTNTASIIEIYAR